MFFNPHFNNLGDSQWKDWSSWSDVIFYTEKCYYLIQNLTVASCKHTNRNRSRQSYDTMSRGNGKSCEGKLSISKKIKN